MRRLRRGQAMVEFALVLPLLITLFFGIFEMGFLFFQDHTVNSVARRAARMAAVATGGTGSTGDAAIRAYVKGQCTNFGLTDAQIVITETSPGGGAVAGNPRTPGDDIRVEITHNLMFITTVQTAFRSVGVTQVKSSAQFVVE